MKRRPAVPFEEARPEVDGRQLRSGENRLERRPEDGLPGFQGARQVRLHEHSDVERALLDRFADHPLVDPGQVDVRQLQALPAEQRLQGVLHIAERRGRDAGTLEPGRFVRSLTVQETPARHESHRDARPRLEVALVGDEAERGPPGDGVEVTDLDESGHDVEFAADQRRSRLAAAGQGDRLDLEPLGAEIPLRLGNGQRGE